MKSIPFLTARWTHLAMVTYAVPPALVEPALPPGCAVDTVGRDALVSLVGFEFSDTRVLGVPWPGYRQFAEVNLRFYVRHGDQRGVCFLREFVGKRLVAHIARAFYNEPFAIAGVIGQVKIERDRIRARRELIIGKKKYCVQIDGDAETARPTTDIERFIIEQELGFGTSRSGKRLCYRVEHPAWEIHPVRAFDLTWDWPKIYGPQWACLQDREPISVLLVAGSEVRLFPRATGAGHRAGAAERMIVTEPI